MANDKDGYWQGMYTPPSSGQANPSQVSSQPEPPSGFDSSQQWQSPHGQTGPQSYQNAYQQPNQQANYQQPGYQQPSYQQPYGQPYDQIAPKDHIAAALLAIFLGTLGIHKFYLGYNQAGFIMLAVSILGSLFTFGLAAMVMGLIAFIEGIIYLVKSQQEFDSIYVYNKKEWF